MVACRSRIVARQSCHRPISEGTFVLERVTEYLNVRVPLVVPDTCSFDDAVALAKPHPPQLMAVTQVDAKNGETDAPNAK